MNQAHLYKILSTRFDAAEAEDIVKEISSLENQNLDRLKEVFAIKTEIYEMERRITENISSKIDKIYWFILGQTTIMVGLILAILRIVKII
jgi:hypothetical protein